jgi:osmotically inducible protein OsmC
MPFDKVLYTAKTHTTGGRDGASHSDDGRLSIKLSSPGTPGTGSNPEQLFAAGWSACFLSSIRLVAGRQKLRLPPDATIDAEVDLGTTDGAYDIAARLKVSLPGIDRETAQALVDGAHQVCTYSRATRGNVDLTITLV